MLYSILLYLLCGLVMDILITGHARAIMLERPLYVGCLSTIITLTSLLLLEHLITSRSIVLIVAYAIGSGLGGTLGMYVKRIKR
jgi:hypothetical protein